jgi:UDP-glucuronate 4-epimerase
VQSKKHPNFQFVQMDLKDTEGLDALFGKNEFGFVINLAAQAGVRYSLSNPMAYVDSNVKGFLNILECCRKYTIRHLIYASSSSVYGINGNVPFTEDYNTDKPVSLYAATKKSNELMAYTYSHLYGLPVTGLRFFTVYGPWGRPEMSPILFAKAIVEGKPIKVFNHGNLSRDFTYVADIVKGVRNVLELPAPLAQNDADGHTAPPYRIFNIGNSAPVKLLYFIELMEQALGKKAEKEMLPMQQGDVYETYASTEALGKLADYKASTPIEEGIARFVEWFKSYYSPTRN